MKAKKKGAAKRRQHSNTSEEIPPSLLAMGLEAHREGDTTTARGLYAKIARDSQEFPEARHMLGILHFQEGELDAAAACIRESLLLAPNNPAAVGNLASVYAARGEYAQALPLLERGVSLRPDHGPAWRALADALAGLDRLQEAAQAYERALAYWPETMDQGALPLNYAATLNGLDRHEEAAALLKEFLGRNPANLAAHCNLGRALSALGELDDAVDAFSCALRLEPDTGSKGQVLLGLAGALEKQGELDTAIQYAREAVALTPCEDTWFRLGHTLQGAGEIEESERCYRKALAENPRCFVAMNNLGVLALNEGDRQSADVWFSRARDCAPDYAEAWTNWANLLEKEGDLQQAEIAARKAMELDESTSALVRLAYVLQRQGRIDEALQLYTRCLELDPADAKGVALYLAGIGLRATPERAPEAHVRELFDQYAGIFDRHLQEKLEYKGPEILLDALTPWLRKQEIVDAASNGWDTLDLGCGTGLCGAVLSPFARRLDGVDISRRMLAKARERAIYTDLLEGDLEEVLLGMTQDYDLIVAADVFVYVGDLHAVFTAAYNRMRPGGLFAFSLELLQSPPSGTESKGFIVGENNRYLHAPEYVRELAANAGFTLHSLQEVSTRNEASVPVKGFVVVLEKQA